VAWTGPFWDDDCPERGAGLTHAHWDKCDPNGVHPGSSDRHLFDQCCHCGQFVKARAGRATAGNASHNCTYNAVGVCTICGTHHAFKWTLTGACGLCGQREAICRERQMAHVAERDQVLVEPKAITGLGPTGPRWGRGRWWGSPGELSTLDVKRLEFYVLHLRVGNEP